MPTQSRQLAAIMFTDIVGYTKLMGKDSAKALELVRISKEIQKPLVEKYNGKWLKEMGDGAMAQFSSALDAVNCAIDIQRSSRADFEADLRIGIHLGDITIENNDVYGDGVNVAARLESIADPGGIYISESIEKAIRGQSEVQAKYIGEVNLKNVDYGVRTYALQGVGLPLPNVKTNKEISGRIYAEIKRRGVIRAGIMYILVSLLLILLLPVAANWVTALKNFGPLLHTVLAIGFPIAIFLAWRYERSPEGFVRSTSKQSWRNPMDVSKRKPFTGNVIMTGLSLLIAFLFFFSNSIVTPKKTDALVENVSDDKSIAVLPFENLSSDAENQYFADGQMEAILNHLAKIADLRVISRTTMMAYRGTTRSVPDIARELGVRYILEGSVQKAGQQVRITAQLIDSGSDEHLWSENYDRDLADIFGIQTEIAKKVVQELQMTITAKEQQNLESIPTTNLTAYDFYLKGLEFESRSRGEEDLRYALQMYERAVELDPMFTLAWVGLASVSRSMYWFYHDRTTERLEQTKAYLDKATLLDPDLLEAQIESGRYYYQCRLNYPKALEILESLLSQYPKNDQLQFWTGAVYRRMGQFEKAFEFMDRAIKLNPSDWTNWMDAAGTLVILKKYKQAETYYKTTIDLNPSIRMTYSMLCRVYILTGELEKAIAFVNNHFEHLSDNYNIRSDIKLMERKFQQAISIMDSSSSIINDRQFGFVPKAMRLGLMHYMMSGKAEANSYFQEAKQILEEKLVELPDDSRIYGSLGIVYAGLGMHEEALDAGNKALSIMNTSIDAMRGSVREKDMAKILLMVGEYDKAITKLEGLIQQSGNMTVELLKLEPFWDPLRDMEEFKALINNPEYQINWNNN